MDKKPPVLLNLPSLAALLLLDALEAPGWATTPSDFGNAFAIQERLPRPDEPEILRGCASQRKARELAPDFCAAVVTVELSQKEADTAKKCFTVLRDKAALPVGWATRAIMAALKMETE